MNVVPLGPPARPRDGGLASLGVVMMASAIACSAIAWCAGVIAMIDVLCSMAIDDIGRDSLLSRASPTACGIAVALTVARGVLGFSAGRALATGRDARALLAGYAAAGVGHAIAVAVVVAPSWARLEVVSVLAALAMQPCAALVTSPFARAKVRTGAREAVPVLALLFGVIALVIAAALLLPALHVAGAGLDAARDRYVLVPPLHALLILGTGLGVIAVAIAVAVGVAGALMFRAGLGDRAALEDAARATGFAGFVLTIGLSILVLTAVAIPAVVALCMAFPRLLCKAADAEPPRPPDPSARRAALAWILLGHGLMCVAALLPAALTGASATIAASVVAAPGASWIGVALAALELGAAAALLSGHRTARAITLAWSAGGIAVAVSGGQGPILAAWFACVPVVALIASSPLTETLRARAKLVRSLEA